MEIPGPFEVLTRQIWIKSEDRKPPLTGEAIVPKAVQAASDPEAKAVNLINRSGLNDRDLDGLGEHSGSTDHMWLSAKGQTQGWLEFDLGEPQPVGTICIWNYNDTWRTNRGIRKADISVWTQEKGWQKLRDDVPLERAEGGDDYDEATIVNLDAVQAQKVRLDDLENFGDTDQIGLSEVQFYRPRGPEAARPYPPDGADGAGIRDMELRWVAGEGAKAHNLYLGASPDDLKLMGKVEQASATLASLEKARKYYWRVDEVQADGSTVKGQVWSFTTGMLAAWWKLDEAEGTAVADNSGHGHDGVIHGSPAWLPAGGQVGGALQFDGVDDYVDTGWAADLPTYTVAAWIKSPAAPISLPMTSGPVHREKNFQINWNHGDDKFRGAAGVRVGGTWYGASFGDLKPDTWYHLAATYDGESLKAYKDGIVVTDNASPSGKADAETETLKFGRHAVADAYFAGTIDDVSIFTYALSPDEIKALHAGKSPIDMAGLPAVASAEMLRPKLVPTVQEQAADAAPPAQTGGRSWVAVVVAVVVVLVAVGVIAGVSMMSRSKPTARS